MEQCNGACGGLLPWPPAEAVAETGPVRFALWRSSDTTRPDAPTEVPSLGSRPFAVLRAPFPQGIVPRRAEIRNERRGHGDRTHG